jgi:hypothetical protein
MGKGLQIMNDVAVEMAKKKPKPPAKDPYLEAGETLSQGAQTDKGAIFDKNNPFKKK